MPLVSPVLLTQQRGLHQLLIIAAHAANVQEFHILFHLASAIPLLLPQEVHARLKLIVVLLIKIVRIAVLIVLLILPVVVVPAKQ